MASSKSLRIAENALTFGGFSRGLGLVVMMLCKDGREGVLKNAGDWVYSHGAW